jgi:hypothetical protein
MKRNRVKILWYVLFGLFVTLMVTNPSLDDFKENGHYGNVSKEHNFLILSIFQHSEYFHYDDNGTTITDPTHLHTKRYIGIFKNFFQISANFHE